MPANRYTNSDLEALKNTIREIVQDECAPLEAEYLANPPQEG